MLQGVTGVGLLKVGAGLAAAAGTVELINQMTEDASKDVQDLATSFDDIETSTRAIPDSLSIDVDQTSAERLKKLREVMDDSTKSGKELERQMKRLRESTGDLINDLERSTENARYEFESLNMDPLQRQIADIERDIQTRIRDQIKELEEAMTPENAAEITRQINALKDAASTAITEQSRLVTESYEYQRSFAYGWNQAFQQYKDDATNAADAARDIFQKSTSAINSAIDDFVETGKFSLKGLLEDIAKTAAKTVLKTGVNNLISNIMGNAIAGPVQGPQQPSSGGISGFFKDLGRSIGLFANGGYLPAGQFGIVGERQPEMIVGPASVRPSANGGGALAVTINAVDARSFKQLVASDPEFIYSVAQRGARSFR